MHSVFRIIALAILCAVFVWQLVLIVTHNDRRSEPRWEPYVVLVSTLFMMGVVS